MSEDEVQTTAARQRPWPTGEVPVFGFETREFRESLLPVNV
jgi:hypothetical protein